MTVRLWLAEEIGHTGWAVVAIGIGSRCPAKKEALARGLWAYIVGVGNGD